ncbi:MAG: hypothetical protein ACOC3T_01265 [Bacteroidota bacterium]
MKKFVLTFSVFFLGVMSSFAQTDTLQANKIISFVPQYLINSGIRVDYDIRLSDRHWLQLAPQIYLRDRSSSDPEEYYPDYHQLYGAGLFLYHKQYLKQNSEPEGAYLSYGLTYNYFYLNYDEEWVNSYVERYSKINKLGGDIIIGISTILFDYVTLDIYAGLGVRYSLLDSDAENPRHFNDFYSDFGYTGNMMSLGLRLGVIR